jgi:hypothetical protein
LVSKLPPICRQIITQLFTMLHRSGISSHILAPLFARLLLRETAHLDGSGSGSPSSADAAIVRFTALLMDHIEYISLLADEPTLDPQSAAMQPTLGDFVLEGVGMYDFPGGREGTLPFRRGQTILIINVHRNDWLEGFIGTTRGFLPASYIEIVPLTEASAAAAK